MMKANQAGYHTVAETHRDNPNFRWKDSPVHNRIRWYMLTGGPYVNSSSAKARNLLDSIDKHPLHLACKIGFKEMATMIVIEAR